MTTPIDKIKEHLGIWQGVDERAVSAPWCYKGGILGNKYMDIEYGLFLNEFVDQNPHDLEFVIFSRNNSAVHRQVIEKLVEALTSIEERLKALPEIHKVIDSISRLTDIEVGLAKEAFDISQKALVECAEILEKEK